MSESVFCVSATKFAGISGLSYEVIKKYLRQGRIPFIQAGKSHVKIPVQKGLAAVEKIAEESAQNKNPDIMFTKELQGNAIDFDSSRPKRKGRTPDKVKMFQAN